MAVKKNKICQYFENTYIRTNNSFEDIIRYLESKNCCEKNKCDFECICKSKNGLFFILPEKKKRYLHKRLIRLSAHILYYYTVINALPYGVGILNQSLHEYESKERNLHPLKNYIIEPDWDILD